jgi:HEAT repeat protein
MVRPDAKCACASAVVCTFMVLLMGFLHAADGKERMDREARLIEILKSDASVQEKDHACRELQIIGSPASIPALAALLTDKDLSHMARYALEPMPYPQAGQALRLALTQTTSVIKVGIINSLGFREEKEAAPDLIKLLKDLDTEVISSAAAALGRIGTPEAALALEKFRKTAAPPLQAVAAEASLTAAERLLNNNHHPDAVRIYEQMQAAKWPVHVRQGAFAGLLKALPAEAVTRTVRAIEGGDPILKPVAIANIPMLKDPSAAGRLSSMLPTLPTDTQILMIGALAECESKSTLPVLQNALAGPNQEVKLAAVKALGKAGDASCVKALSELLSDAIPEALKKEAIGSLERLRGDGVNMELVACLKTAPVGVRTMLIGILVSRRATDAWGDLFQEARGEDVGVREAAFKALGSLGGANNLPAVLKLLTELKGEEGRTELELVAARLARKIPAEGAQADAVLDLLGAASETPIRCSLLRVLGGIANWKALEAMRAALGAKVPEVKETAIKALSNWPDSRAIDLLLAEWRTASDPTQKTSMLRGCVRLLRHGDGLPSQTIVRYKDLLNGAQRPEDKILVLSGMAEVAEPAAIELVEPSLRDPQVKAEAELSMLQITRRVMSSDPMVAKGAALKLWTEGQSEEIREQAAEMIREIEQSEDYLMAWQVAGPYSRMGGEGLRLFDVVLPPEKDDLTVKWRDLPLGSRADKPWMLDLASFLGEARMRAAYARTWIYSEKALNAILELGAGDPVKIWLNSELVHLHNISVSSTLVDERMGISLKPGWNLLVLKIVKTDGPWEFSVKLRKPNGEPLDGVRFDAAYGEKVQTEQIFDGSSANWVQLFNGKDLTGWRKTGDAIFTVEDGHLVGTQTTGKGGDLLTESEWDNFELRVVYRIVWPANSGFWFRFDGANGYQFDVLKWKKPIGFSGTLYMPGKMFLTVNLNEALENRDDWNEARVRARGDELKLWLNGIKVGECQESTFRKGAFGIQVHPGDEFKGMKVLIKSVEVRSLETHSTK